MDNSTTPKLRVYFTILGTESYHQEVSSPEEARLVINSIANFVILQIKNGVFPDHCSVAGLEIWDETDNEYVEWYDEDGYDLDQHFAMLNEA